MSRWTVARVALGVAGAVFAVQGVLLTSGADVPHPVGHAVFGWGYVALGVALWQLRHAAPRGSADLALVGALLAVAAAVAAVLVALPVLVVEGLGDGATPGPLHALEAGTFLVYPAIAAASVALVRAPRGRLLGGLLLVGLVLDVGLASWAFGVCALLAATVARSDLGLERRHGALTVKEISAPAAR